MVDPNEYIGDPPTAYSHVHLEYEPSLALHDSLHRFIKPELRAKAKFARLALRSEAYLVAPIERGGHALQHPPAVAQHLQDYQKRLDTIKDRQLRLASFVELSVLKDESLMFHFELLPDERERRALGRLALKNSHQSSITIGAAVHIPSGAVYDPYGEASAELRGLLGMSHPAFRDRHHTTPAPLIN
ncbi:MAG: hypothetical protein ABWX90_01920, partial [Candidatus Saccharimonadales bacterium]